jgi:hypothetical protein
MYIFREEGVPTTGKTEQLEQIEIIWVVDRKEQKFQKECT